MLSGTVTFDLRDAARERMRNRLFSLPEVPNGARVVVQVGALAPEPEAIRLLAEHESRLLLDIQGMPSAVRRWLDAVRTCRDGEVLL
jgi:hypothetical protein